MVSRQMIRSSFPLTAQLQQVADDRCCAPVDHGKYRVLMLLEDWNAGGTEQYVTGLTRYLKKHEDCEIHLVLLRAAAIEPSSHLLELFAGVHCLNSAGFIALKRLIAQLDPDVCHCHLYTSLLPATLALRACRVRRLVTTFHMPLSAWSLRHRLMWRAASALADQSVYGSETTARSMAASKGKHGRKICVIPPPVPKVPVRCTSVASTRARAFTVCGCGRLATEKDWPTLIRAFSEVRQRFDQSSRLVLLGNGPLEHELRALVDRLGISESIDMPGAVSHDAVLEAFQRSSVFVLPSRFEGFGVVAIEAMQCGVPTITSDFEASGEYIEHGVTGHCFARGDVPALRDLLLWHGDHPDDSRAMGRRGREFVGAQYSEEATFACQMSAYLGVQSVQPEDNAIVTRDIDSDQVFVADSGRLPSNKMG